MIPQRTLVSPVLVGRDDLLDLVGGAARRGPPAEPWAPLTARDFEVAQGRRAEVAAWTATIPVLHSRPHGGDREE